MPSEMVEYEEHEFPANWPNARRIEWINNRLSDPEIFSVELFRRTGKLIARVWFDDHVKP